MIRHTALTPARILTAGLLLLGALLTPTFAHAQRPGGGGPPGGMGMPGPGGGPQGQGGPGQGLGILPPGPFWKNPDLIKLLGLTADQQKHMDEIVHQSRVELIHLKAALDEAQLNLEPVLNATPFDQAKALDAASKIIDLRSSLEKADAKMLLSLRNLLTPDQWTKLQADMHAHHGQGGPGSPDGKRNHRDFNGPNPNGPPPAGIEDNQ